MSDFRHDLITVLSGGLPALLDGGGGGPQTSTPINTAPPGRVEETPPSGTFRDQEPFLMRVSPPQILVGTAIVLALIGVVMIARR